MKTLLILLVLLVGPVWGWGAERAFVVIVPAQSPITSVSEKNLSNIFLKKDTHWPDGHNALPYEWPEGSVVRKSFTEAIHRKEEAAINAHWQRMIFSGRASPPPSSKNVGEIIRYVEENPGAVAYLPTDTPVPPSVKTISVTTP